MSQYLEALIPDGLVAWYPLAEVTAGGNISTVQDYSGNGRNLSSTGTTAPDFVLDALGGRPTIRFNNEDPLVYTPGTSFVAKQAVVVSQYTGGTTFADYNGLLGYTSATNPLLVGNIGTNDWFNFPDTTVYYKSGVLYPESGMDAAITIPEVQMISNSAGWTFNSSNGLQIGKQFNFASRTWKGDLYELMLFDRVLTAQERASLDLYFGLKFDLSNETNAVLNFPGPTVSGIEWARYKKIPRNWERVTIIHTYEDESKTFSDTSDTPPQFWDVGFTGLTEDETEIFDEFWEAVRLKNPFNFTDKYGVTHSGVRIAEYNRDHDGNKSWSNQCSFSLVKYY